MSKERKIKRFNVKFRNQWVENVRVRKRYVFLPLFVLGIEVDKDSGVIELYFSILGFEFVFTYVYSVDTHKEFMNVMEKIIKKTEEKLMEGGKK